MLVRFEFLIFFFFKKSCSLGFFFFNILFYFILFYFILFYCLFRAATMAYGGSQARGLIRAIAASLRHSHSHARSEPSRVCNLHHRSWQCEILNPLSKPRDRTQNFMVSSQIRFRCARMRTPLQGIFKGCCGD